MAKLGDVCTLIRNGASIKQTEGAGGFPITRIETIANREVDRKKFGYANIVDISKYESYILQDGDILMSHINSEKHLGKVALYKKQGDEQIIHGMNLLLLRANPKILLPSYAAYYFETPAFLGQIQRITKKSVNQASFTVTALKEVEIPLPSLDNQRHIVAVLDKVTDLIAQRRAQLDKLDLLVKSRFVEMFGDPTLNPYGLERKRFDAICENLDSRRKPITASERVAGIYPYYGASGIVDYVEDYIFDEDILLISEDGANLLMRSTPIAFSVSGKVWVNNHAHVVRFDNSATQKYIEVYFSLIDISDQVTGSAQPKLNQAKLNAMEFMYPPIDLQNQFAAFVNQINKSKVSIRQSLNKLDLIKKSLMQQYFKKTN